MADMEQEIRRRYLDRLGDPAWGDEDPRLDFGSTALPYFLAAFKTEADPLLRARLVRVIWQFRDPAAMQTLAVAAGDSSSHVWKDALDGLVALGGEDALKILNEARATAAASGNTEKAEWIDEAARQLKEGY